MKEQNYFIDFLRFVFSVCILLYHSWVFAGSFGNGIFNYGFLAVDFYFIVTGYLMMMSIYKMKSTKTIMSDSFTFIYKKIKRLFPSLVAAFIIGIIFVYGKNIFYNPSVIFSDKVLPELFQLGIFGYELSVNSSWWYISAMIFSMSLLYPVAIKYKDDYCKYIAPLIIFFTIGFIKMNNIVINDPVNISYFLRNGFYQALIFIPIGNVVYSITNSIKNKNFNINVLSGIEVALYIILILNMHYYFMDRFLFVVLLSLNIALSFSNKTFLSKIFRHSFWKKLGEYGFYIYLCNISIRTFIINNYLSMGLSYYELLFKFIVLSCLTALLLYIGVEIIYKKMLIVKK